MRWFENESCTLPRGFRASGIHCGIKKSPTPDFAMLISDTPACAAGVFTQNFVRAACVEWNEKVLRTTSSDIRGVVINSGNANAVTGAIGVRDNIFIATETARITGCNANQILVGSTGVIGVPLPMLNVANGIRLAHGALLNSGGNAAAEAIRTTDTKPKHIALESRSGYRIGGMAKGAGMIHPNMATMISVITTDAVISPAILQQMTHEITEKTFNCISIDGDTSTNDMFLVIANGASGIEPDLNQFANELWQVAMTLAKKIVSDAEGASRFVEVRVRNAQSEAEAKKVARTISTSLLFKTAIFGADPNWGRVLAAAGRAGVELNLSKISLSFAGISVLEKGELLPFDELLAHEKLKSPEVLIELDIGQGEFSSSAYTSDLTHEYININSSYRS